MMQKFLITAWSVWAGALLGRPAWPGRVFWTGWLVGVGGDTRIRSGYSPGRSMIPCPAHCPGRTLSVLPVPRFFGSSVLRFFGSSVLRFFGLSPGAWLG